MQMDYEQKLADLGRKLPAPWKLPETAGNIPIVKAEDYLYVSGHPPIPLKELSWKGKVGTDLTVEDAGEVAISCVLNCLSSIKAELGTLNKIDRIVKIVGFINSADGFIQQSEVMNKASEFLMKIFGKDKKHARTSIGAKELPQNIAVEVEMIVKIKKEQ